VDGGRQNLDWTRNGFIFGLFRFGAGRFLILAHITGWPFHFLMIEKLEVVYLKRVSWGGTFPPSFHPLLQDVDWRLCERYELGAGEPAWRVRGGTPDSLG
jgi:hypothetical protein